MFRTMMAVAVALALGGGPAAGQDAAAFIDRAEVRSAQISPGGGEVAFIRRTDGKQAEPVAKSDHC